MKIHPFLGLNVMVKKGLETLSAYDGGYERDEWPGKEK